MDTSQLLHVYSIEAALGVLALLLIAVDLLKGGGRLTGPADAVRATAWLGLLAILGWACWLTPDASTAGAHAGGGAGTIGAVASTVGTLDTFALWFKRFFLTTAIFVLALSGPYEHRLPAGRAEFPTLL